MIIQITKVWRNIIESTIAKEGIIHLILDRVEKLTERTIADQTQETGNQTRGEITIIEAAVEIGTTWVETETTGTEETGLHLATLIENKGSHQIINEKDGTIRTQTLLKKEEPAESSLLKRRKQKP